MGASIPLLTLVRWSQLREAVGRGIKPQSRNIFFSVVKRKNTSIWRDSTFRTSSRIERSRREEMRERSRGNRHGRKGASGGRHRSITVRMARVGQGHLPRSFNTGGMSWRPCMPTPMEPALYKGEGEAERVGLQYISTPSAFRFTKTFVPVTYSIAVD